DDISRNAKQVAAACGLEIPKAKKYVLAIVLVPVFLLIAVYVPPVISANRAMNAQIAVASESVYALQSAFEDGCDSVMIDDPQERYNDDSYTVSGYLYSNASSDIEATAYVTVDNDGFIISVHYMVYIDIEADKVENLEMTGTDLRELNSMLNNSGVEAISDDLMDTCELPEEFVTRFQESSYYEEISVKEGENIYVHYETDTEEDYDEHSNPYIYVLVKPKN
ncbi:MAG: hypothetical protein LUC60_01430, partial [Lachnospiraceae bacterium]|nr:hypothetical protein [Lachnospiraceae bacterium]